ncbi:SpoIID/LytB domain-containing protein [Deinococcus radiophilus]|uniref:SpoIID/LytB domain-containing protein n=1 Tax=Deinococcus radiophilus TaxID=32062 RepID=A0A3S0L8G6_9DEIO|nr:SpoIID/LytB domain-containing protein [Deinococcus radiophilus]RTR29404.1 SpoIID/LytB domain-containing protein [Deinococcus radiophilus]UFA50768.1 SpoIID/LytB domain-containing protein [Deinococcus radiophilus]
MFSRRLLHTVRLGTATLAVLASGSGQALDVRVLIQEGASVPVRLLGTGGAPQASAPVWKVEVRGSELALNGKSAGSSTLYVPPSPGSRVQIGSKVYRGGVLLRLNRGKVQGINVVNVEDYLRGVVPAEMPALWPEAALESQAVVARTYVTQRVNPAQPFDICAGTNCQMYPGIDGEHERTNAAIDATRGEVLTYGGQLADTYFSANSGGYTASAAEVWGKNLPYLIAKPDPQSVTASGERGRWQITVSPAKLNSAATAYRLNVGTVRRVSFGQTSASGRVEEVTVVGSSRTSTLKGASAGGFVRALGAPSSRARVDSSSPLRLSGQGSGHGVGLSQYGALGFAREGRSHRDVLGFYYPGTVVQALHYQPVAAATQSAPVLNAVTGAGP